MIFKLVLLCVTISNLRAEKEWIWRGNRRIEDNDYSYDRGGLERYEVHEPGEQFNGQRPGGGVYTQIKPGNNYGQGQGNYFPNEKPLPGILTGPIPSWQQQGPIKDFDKCKCTEKFNCPTPGISYGHCDVGKQYCCYSTTKKGQIGGPVPARPVYSIENGILAGPGGPVDRPILQKPLQRPLQRPLGNYQKPGGFGLSNRPRHHYTGVLVGPGGPYDD